MNKINEIIYSVIFLVLIFATGCTKLDDRVYSEIVASNYEYSEGDLARIVGKAYQQLRYLAYGSFDAIALNDETADASTALVSRSEFTL